MDYSDVCSALSAGAWCRPTKESSGVSVTTPAPCWTGCLSMLCSVSVSLRWRSRWTWTEPTSWCEPTQSWTTGTFYVLHLWISWVQSIKAWCSSVYLTCDQVSRSFLRLRLQPPHRKRSPVCLSRTARCPSALTLTGRDSARVKTSPSMPSLRTRVPVSWCRRRPSSPNTHTWLMDMWRWGRISLRRDWERLLCHQKSCDLSLWLVFQVLRQKLSAVRGNHIISGMCDMWQGKTIRVPKLKPSLLGCDIIKVDYALMVSQLESKVRAVVMTAAHQRWRCDEVWATWRQKK